MNSHKSVNQNKTKQKTESKQNNRIKLLFQKKNHKIHFKKKNKNDWNKGKRWRRKNEKNSIQLISFCMAFIIIIVIVVVGHHHHWWNPIVRQSDNNTKVFFFNKRKRKREKNTKTHTGIKELEMFMKFLSQNIVLCNTIVKKNIELNIELKWCMPNVCNVCVTCNDNNKE